MPHGEKPAARRARAAARPPRYSPSATSTAGRSGSRRGPVDDRAIRRRRVSIGDIGSHPSRSGRLKSYLRGPLARTLELSQRLSRRRVGGVLVYHRVDAAARGWDPQGLNFATGAAAFAEHLRYLRARYRLVSASELLEATERRRFGERIPVALTFDDDYASHLSLAMPLLVEAGAPAMFFVCGAGLAGPAAFWWERLERALGAGAIEIAELRRLVPTRDGADADERNVRAIAGDVEWMDLGERKALAAELQRRLGPDPPDSGLRAEQLRELAAAGFEVGFHTRHHPNLTLLDDDELSKAMAEGRDALEAAIGGPLSPVIAYPGGKWDRRVADAARAGGYALGFTSDPRPVARDAERLALGRLAPVWCETADQLALALARMLRRSPAAVDGA